MTGAFVRQEVIYDADLDPNDLRCPKCTEKTLVLTGNCLTPRREVLEDGITVETTIEEDSRFDVTRIDCVPCQTTFLIRESLSLAYEIENLQLREENQELKRELGKLEPGNMTVRMIQ